MSHRAKYSLEEKMNVLNEYDRGKATKRIAEEYQIPISTVLYFIRNRTRFENEAGGSDGVPIRNSTVTMIDPIISTNLNQTDSPSTQEQKIREKKIRFAENIVEDPGCNQPVSKDQDYQEQTSLNQLRKRKCIRRHLSSLKKQKTSQHRFTSQQSSSEDEQQTSQHHQMIRIRKIPYDMKMKIIKAWENRDRSAGGVGWSMRKIAERFGVSTRSVSRCIAAREDLKSLTIVSTNNNANSNNKDVNPGDYDDEEEDIYGLNPNQQQEQQNSDQNASSSGIVLIDPQQVFQSIRNQPTGVIKDQTSNNVNNNYIDGEEDFEDEDEDDIEHQEDNVNGNGVDDEDDQDPEEGQQEDEYFVVSSSSPSTKTLKIPPSQLRRRHQNQTQMDDMNYTSNLDHELVESVNNVFDQLKRIRVISEQRLPSPLNRDALEFTEAMLRTANRYVDRLCQRTIGESFSSFHRRSRLWPENHRNHLNPQQQPFQMKQQHNNHQKISQFSMSCHDWPGFSGSTSTPLRTSTTTINSSKRVQKIH